MQNTREDPFIKLFLSAYENGTWADAALTKPDAIDRKTPAVDQLATRKSDWKTVAIEHTIIEPFLGDKQDFAAFGPAFLDIENDKSLVVPGKIIQVFVPVGALSKQPSNSRDAIVGAVRDWIKANRTALPDHSSEHSCALTGIRGLLSLTLTVKVTPLNVGAGVSPGYLYVRRQQVANNLGNVMEKALGRKLPKLVNTAADKRILLFERQHMILTPKLVLNEIEKCRGSFPELADVDEIWFIETTFYGTAFGRTYLRFERHVGDDVVASYDFHDGKLITKFENGVGEVVRRVGT